MKTDLLFKLIIIILLGLLLYCKDSKGETQKGLKIRRIAERLLFEDREWYEEAKELQRNKFSYLIEREKQLFKKVIPEEEIPKPRGMEEIK